ncbi:hypothetical protein KBP30_00575 [Streptomyces sp. Go40/10]|uniref:hypothetical protein n=1 Tax=Streptomyces sp. Go40/10 TaxID=2825844 RepID=UPI001E330965|nr:hypothetical protein [Streptomyces sp. Go40/10]UFQ99818.1 hypothetical protein KBP30_00575 [Streptomyces sp. Go40/10]
MSSALASEQTAQLCRERLLAAAREATQPLHRERGRHTWLAGAQSGGRLAGEGRLPDLGERGGHVGALPRAQHLTAGVHGELGAQAVQLRLGCAARCQGWAVHGRLPHPWLVGADLPLMRYRW